MLHIISLLFAALVIACAQPTLSADRQPNVIVILSDDQGWGDLSINGNTNLETPHVDSLAKNGAMIDRFFVCPVCSPTRAEFLTGRYHLHSGVWSTSTGGERLNPAERTIADVFAAAGYSTACFGKWHNGTQWPFHPLARGFEEYYGFTSGHWGDYFSPPLDHNGKITEGSGYLPDDLTDHAIQFIQDHCTQPFFCYLPLNIPHSPMQVPDRFWQKFAGKELTLRSSSPKQEDINFTRAVLAMCENIDWNVGRLLAKLDQLRLAEHTIVVYFCDNGPNSARWNGGMRGRKGSTDEGGVRSPCHIRWTGHIPPGTRVLPIAGAIDLLPTLAGLAGVKLDPQQLKERPLDGMSLAPLVLGGKHQWPDRLIYSHWNGKVSVRSQQYRLDDAGNLYDMQQDPGQEKNIATQQPQLTARLASAVSTWKAEMLPKLKKDLPFTVGYREMPLAQLPARDGVPHGGVERSARAPNCSYFTGWKSTDDRITWDIAVATPGKYQAELWYACPAKDVGSTVELSFGDRKLQFQVSEAHDPPLRGEEHDRVPRVGESYVRAFKPLKLGTIELPAERGELTLRALKIPGRQVMEVRGLFLTLVD